MSHHDDSQEKEQFTALPGQEHWHCECAQDIAAILRAVNFRLEAGAEPAEDE